MVETTMVELDFIKKVVECTQQLLLSKFKEKAEILLFIPVENDLSYIKYNLIISSKKLDSESIRNTVSLIFGELSKRLNGNESNKIFRINILRSNESLINNLRLIIPVFHEIVDINNLRVGNINLDKAFLYKEKMK